MRKLKQNRRRPAVCRRRGHRRSRHETGKPRECEAETDRASSHDDPDDDGEIAVGRYCGGLREIEARTHHVSDHDGSTGGQSEALAIRSCHEVSSREGRCSWLRWTAIAQRDLPSKDLALQSGSMRSRRALRTFRIRITPVDDLAQPVSLKFLAETGLSVGHLASL